MKRLLIPLFFLALLLPLPREALAQGEPRVLPREISQDLRLEGDWLLEETAGVPPQVTLVLEKGSRLRVRKGGSLFVGGRLEARGTAERPVTIELEPGEAGNPGSWGGITLHEGSAGDLSHARISGADTGISVLKAQLRLTSCILEKNGLAVHLVKEGRLEAEGTAFTGNRTALGTEMKSTGWVRRSRFRDNGVGVGIASGSEVEVSACRFTGNKAGIQVHQRYSHPITNCVFERNGVGVRLYQNGPETVVERNLFLDSSEAAVLALSFSSPRVANNRIERGKAGIVAHQFSSPILERNHIVDMEEGLHLNKKCMSPVRGNVISRCRTGVFLDFSSYPEVRDNLFEGNQAHVRLGRFESADWEAREGSRHIVLETAADAGSKNPRLAGAGTSFPTVVDLTGNAWDKGTLQEMKAKGKEGNIGSLADGRDQPTATYEGFEGREYKLDLIVFSPWKEDPPKAGLTGWTGKEKELGVAD